MSINKIIATLVLVIVGMGSAFAAGEYGASGAGVGEARRVGKVIKGTLLEARPVSIKVEAGYGAKAAGASIGAAIGGMVGDKVGNGNYVAAGLLGTLGGIIGGIAGDVVGTETREAVEMVVMVDGDLITVIQEAKGTVVPPEGSEVYIATVNDVTRVFPITASKAPASINKAGFRRM